MTTREILVWAEAELTKVGCATPRLDSQILFEFASGIDRATQIADPDGELNADARREFEALVDRRAQREPVAYITQTKGFRHLELHVDRRVLIPRPETELLVEAVLDVPADSRVVDVGTGSGAVALALKDERPDLRVFATDESADALVVASANAKRLRLEVDFFEADLLGAVANEVDVIVSNPPYVTEAEYSSLEPEIQKYEPASALLAGTDGLDVYRRLSVAAVESSAALVAVEIGSEQGEGVSELFTTAGFDAVEVLRDLAGLPRVVRAKRSISGEAR